jgi:hypothetical protein
MERPGLKIQVRRSCKKEHGGGKNDKIVVEKCFGAGPIMGCVDGVSLTHLQILVFGPWRSLMIPTDVFGGYHAVTLI